MAKRKKVSKTQPKKLKLRATSHPHTTIPKKSSKSSSKKDTKKIEKKDSDKKEAVTTISYENEREEKSLMIRFLPVILLALGYLIAAIPSDGQIFFVIGLILFVIGFALLPLLIQRKNFGWWMWGILFLIVGLATTFFRGTSLVEGNLIIDLSYFIGGIFLTLSSLFCIPKTFKLINSKEKISTFYRIVIIIILYVISVIFYLFTSST